MSIRLLIVYIASAILLALSGLSVAAEPEGDVEYGRLIGYTCLGCHGIEGYRNAYPSYRVPKLGGQRAEYLKTALRAYRAGTRQHPTMEAQAATLSNEDIENLIAWLGTYAEVQDQATIETAAGLEQVVACVACHGAEGEAVVPQPPTLAGQHPDYLARALKHYRDGDRPGNVMSAFALNLSDEDIELLATFYGSQDGLATPEQSQQYVAE